MFSGIVKKVEPIVGVRSCGRELKIQVRRPQMKCFSNLKLGESVAVDGVCLTLEKLSSKMMQFHLGEETLNITGSIYWKQKNRLINLELPLRMGQFVGGHFVSGHIDGMAQIISVQRANQVVRSKKARSVRNFMKSGSFVIELKLPNKFKDFFWNKCFIALNGVSLTVNKVIKNKLSVCLIPETLKCTNLGSIVESMLDTDQANSKIFSAGKVSGFGSAKNKDKDKTITKINGFVTFGVDPLSRAVVSVLKNQKAFRSIEGD